MIKPRKYIFLLYSYFISPCSRHLSVLASAAALPHVATQQRTPPPWLMHRPDLPFAVFPHPSIEQRTPPPCRTHFKVLPCAHLVHPSTSQRRPPPARSEYSSSFGKGFEVKNTLEINRKEEQSNITSCASPATKANVNQPCQPKRVSCQHRTVRDAFAGVPLRALRAAVGAAL